MGDLIQFPMDRVRLPPNVIPMTSRARAKHEESCFDCWYVAMGPSGTHCLLFHEPIFNELTEAAECEAFTTQEDMDEDA